MTIGKDAVRTCIMNKRENNKEKHIWDLICARAKGELDTNHLVECFCFSVPFVQ